MQIVDIDFCVPEDLDALYAIELACFDSPWPRHVLEYELPDPGEVIYVKAILKEAIAGYCVLRRVENVAHLLNLAVLPDYRRQGVASQLMLACDEIAAQWGCRRMRLEVRSSNVGARTFYAGMSFSYAMRARGYYADGEDALILVARLPLKIK